MRTISIDGVDNKIYGKPLKLTPEERNELKQWLLLEHAVAKDARSGWEQTMAKVMRMYQGLPPQHRWTPWENAPMIEVPIIASDCDAIVSQAEDLVFGMDPPLLCRSKKSQQGAHLSDMDATAEALQDLIDIETDSLGSGTWNFVPGVKEGIIDQVQMGTVVWYVPYTKTVRVTDLRKVETFGPKVYCLSPSDFLLPHNATKDIQSAKWCTMRMRMSRSDLNLSARLNNWQVDDATTPDSQDPIRSERLKTAGLTGGWDKKPTMEVGLTYAYYDFGDGLARDLEIIWNMTSGGIMKCQYHHGLMRPFVLECYQDRAHTWAGLGVGEMDIVFEDEATEIHNNAIWNMMVANTKVYQGPSTAMQETTNLYPGLFIPNDDGKIEALDMGAPNPSAFQAEAIVRQIAKERTGLGQLQAPMRSTSRTPGFTMQMAMQAANRRFSHPFNNLRNGIANVVLQCLLRIQERVRAGDRAVTKRLEELLGPDSAKLVITLMKRSDMELTAAMDIQLKAVSVTINREADRQNMVMLATQVFPLYYNVKKELAALIAHPPFPGADEVAREASKVIDRFWHKILKTFDSTGDVKSLQIDLDVIQPMMQQLGMEQVPGQLNGALTAMNGGQPPDNKPGQGAVPLQ